RAHRARRRLCAGAGVALRQSGDDPAPRLHPGTAGHQRAWQLRRVREEPGPLLDKMDREHRERHVPVFQTITPPLRMMSLTLNKPHSRCAPSPGERSERWGWLGWGVMRISSAGAVRTTPTPAPSPPFAARMGRGERRDLGMPSHDRDLEDE